MAVRRVLKTTGFQENEILTGSYVWPIENFLDDWTDLESPTFSVGMKDEIQLKLHLHKMVVEAEPWYSVYTTVENIAVQLPAVVTFEHGIAVLSGKEEEACLWVQQETSTYLEEGDSNYIATISAELITGNPRFLILKDTFTIVYEISLRELPSKPETPTGTISEDFKAVFESREDGDLKFFVDSQEFTAHKVIVSARSSVFSKMLRTEMKESLENQVKIEDINAETFKELLRFMYTDQVENLENAYELLKAAQKYDLAKLKLMCEDQLYRDLTVENCTSVFSTADTYSCKRLKQRTLNFIVSNAVTVMHTEGFKLLMSSQPDLMLEVFQALAIRATKK